MRIDLICQLIEMLPFLAEFRRLMGGVQQLAALPLDVVDDALAIQAAVQADRDESWLGGHEAGALSHERQGLGLLAWFGLDDCDLGYRLIVGVDAHSRPRFRVPGGGRARGPYRSPA